MEHPRLYWDPAAQAGAACAELPAIRKYRRMHAPPPALNGFGLELPT
jgi:hypothetical protein